MPMIFLLLEEVKEEVIKIHKSTNKLRGCRIAVYILFCFLEQKRLEQKAGTKDDQGTKDESQKK